MPSYSDKWTDKQLAELEARIRKEYGVALKDMGVILDEFVNGTTYTNKDGKEARGKSIAQKEKDFEELVKKGIKTQDDLKQWRLNQMGRQARFEAMRDKLAERLTEANQTALDYVNGTTPGIYCLNRNYEAYTIEQVAGASDFTLWDEATVRRLLVEEPDTMPEYIPPKERPKNYPKEKVLLTAKDVEYGKSQITKRVTSGILRGASIPDIAKSLREDIVNMGYVSSVRAARTAVTAAQNGGRMDTYLAAEEMGIKLQRQWVATLDGRTRHAHQLLDGQKRKMGEAFEVDGEEIEYPGDPKAAPALVYNCRCTLIAAVEGRGNNGERRARTTDPETGKETWETIPDMSYQEWVKWKEAGKPVDIPRNSGIIGEMNPITGAIESVLETPLTKSDDRNYQHLIDNLAGTARVTNKLEYNAVHMADHEKTDTEIIAELAGGDRTQGSCASVGLAYVGQRQGWDVLDYRDGESRAFFSRGGNLYTLSNAKGVVATHFGDVPGKSACTFANNLLKTCEVGKEYYLSAGRHASVVRKIEVTGHSKETGELITVERLQYLELQSAMNSGWTNFNGNPRYTLTHRFGCSSASGHGERFDFMINITDSNFDTDEFRSILGYINTAENDQRKGKNGSIK